MRLTQLFLMLAIGLMVAFWTQADTPETHDYSQHPYHIAYLVAPDTELEPQVSEPIMDAILNVDVITTWDDLLLYDDLLGLDGLIIHHSAVSMVDDEWLAYYLSRGLIVSGIQIEPQVFADLTQREAMADRYQMIEGEIVYVTIRSYDTELISEDERVTIRRGGGSGIGHFSEPRAWEAFGSMIYHIEDNQRAIRNIFREMNAQDTLANTN